MFLIGQLVGIFIGFFRSGFEKLCDLIGLDAVQLL
jgi:hypothetical protein